MTIFYTPLKPFAYKVHEMNLLVDDATDAELDAMEKACLQLTETNCWWAAYWASPLVLKMVRQERTIRRRTSEARRRDAEFPYAWAGIPSSTFNG